MSKSQLKDISTLFASVIKLLRQFLTKSFDDIKALEKEEQKVLTLNDSIQLSKLLSEHKAKVLILQSSYDQIQFKIETSFVSIQNIYNDIESCDHFAHKLQQDTAVLSYLLSIPKKIETLKIYLSLIHNIIYDNNDTRKYTQVEVLNNMLSTTQYDFINEI